MSPQSGKRNQIKVSQPAHGRDPPSQLRKLDYWGGEPGIKVQYPAPESVPAKRVKATNPEYKDTQQDLTGGFKNPTLKDRPTVSGYLVDFLST